MPYPLFSVYYQWRVVKQWCVLCLAVQALLIAGIINVLANRLYAPMYEITLPILAQAFLLYALPLLVWFTIRSFLLKLREAKNIKRDYLRLKFNTEIFVTLLRKQKQVNVPADSLGIDLGNPEAKNILIKVCNPYCGPCARAHPEIEKLLEEIPDLRVKIIFNATNHDHDTRGKPVKHLLALSAMNDQHTIRKALDDWYLADKKDYEAFAGKYPLNGLLQQQDKKIAAMRGWCDEMGIEYTPTFFLNGYQVPGTYSIADLKYFLLEELPGEKP
jgi:thiol-disulfide isomerase/thioredoxin